MPLLGRAPCTGILRPGTDLAYRLLRTYVCSVYAYKSSIIKSTSNGLPFRPGISPFPVHALAFHRGVVQITTMDPYETTCFVHAYKSSIIKSTSDGHPIRPGTTPFPCACPWLSTVA